MGTKEGATEGSAGGAFGLYRRAPGDPALDGALPRDTGRLRWSILGSPNSRKEDAGLAEEPSRAGGGQHMSAGCGAPPPFWQLGPGFQFPLQSQLGTSL